MIKFLIILVFACISNCEELKKFPVYVGVGYDVVVGNPKTDRIDRGFRNNVFKITYDNEAKTEDGNFLVPDNFQANDAKGCSFSSSTKEFTGVNGYQESLKVLAEISMNLNAWLVSSSFSASAEFKSFKETTTEEDSMVIESQALCDAYSLKLTSFDPPPLSDGFKKAILLAAQKPNDKTIWNDIIEDFGTHYVTRGYFGGRMHLQNIMQRRSFQELSGFGINAKLAASLKYKIFVGETEVGTELERKQLEKFESKLQDTKEIYIGGKPPKTGNWMDWYDEVLIAPMPTSYALKSLSGLISEENFPELKINQIEDLQNAFDKTLHAYCNQTKCFTPDIDRPLPPFVTVTTNHTKHIHYLPEIEFEDGAPPFPFMTARKIILDIHRSSFGSLVCRMRFALSDTINTYHTPIHGYDTLGCDEEVWEVPEGEYVTQIEVYFDNRVNGLKFFTNKGSNSGNKFLPTQNSREIHLLDLDGQLVGIRGRWYKPAFYGISFVTTKIVF